MRGIGRRAAYVRCGGRGMGVGVSRRTDRRGKRERNTLECLAFGCLSVASHLDGIVKGGGWRLLYFEWFELDFDVNRNKRRHTQHDAKHTIARTAPHPA